MAILGLLHVCPNAGCKANHRSAASRPHLAHLVVCDLSCGPAAAQLQLIPLCRDISASHLSDLLRLAFRPPLHPQPRVSRTPGTHGRSTKYKCGQRLWLGPVLLAALISRDPPSHDDVMQLAGWAQDRGPGDKSRATVWYRYHP